VEGDWTWSYHSLSYGCDDPVNCWEAGSYRVELYVAGKKITSEQFEIYGTASPETPPGATISIPGNQPWTDTGLDLNQGDQVTITASGTIKVAPEDPGKTPAGDPSCIGPTGRKIDPTSETWLTPGLTCWSLVGRIGDGAPFQVGTGVSFSVETAGRLYLGVNDENGRFGNNSGSWMVDITVSSAAEEQPPCPTPTVTVSAPSGKPGDTITVQGQNWLPGGTVAIALVDGPAQFDVGSVLVPDSGAWDSSFTVPDTPWDYWLAFSENHEGCELDVQELFTIESSPSVKLDPTEDPPGTQVTATGSGWPAGHEVSVQWEDGTELATPTVDGNGDFTVSFAIPDDAAEGQHAIDFVSFPPEGEAHVISAIFTVEAQPTITQKVLLAQR
jgi:hypothetical protein